MARRKARQLGLTPIGTVGLLLMARNRGLIDAVEVHSKLEKLTNQYGLYISESILKKITAALAQ